MAFTLVTAGSIASAAYTPVAADGANGNKYVNNGLDRLKVNNPDAESLTLTINVPASSDTAFADGNVIADKAIAVTTVSHHIEAFRKDLYDQKASDGVAEDVGAVTFLLAGTLTNVTLEMVAYAPAKGAA